ncbi:MAG: DUF2779 domain-containing protein [Clostridia bacterium]
MYISKSNYTAAKQCYKRLWLKKYRPELAVIDASMEAKFRTGHMVGESAWNLFPGGTLVEYLPNTKLMADETIILLAAGQKVIYEAAFVCGKLLVICDIVVVTDSGLEIYEVKSSTSVKDTYYDDLAFQCYVVKQCGYIINKASIVHLNNQYQRAAELDYQQLFTIVELTELVTQLDAEISCEILQITAMLDREMPPIDIGPYCNNPYACEFSCYCWQHLEDYSVFDLYRIGAKAFDYYYAGIIYQADLQQCGIKLSSLQKLQLEAWESGLEAIDQPKIQEFLRGISYPLYFLDFETFQEAIPSFAGCKPYEQIPFQYSLHYLEVADGTLKHKKFLAKEGTNPKRALAEQLSMDIGDEGTVIAYNISFEGSVLNKLAEEFPDLSARLLAIKARLVDLIVPFRNGHYYNKAMKGSFSIKSVLPALFPEDSELDYQCLEIKNGIEAMSAFPLLSTMPEPDRLQTRQALLEYCKLDTYAMVRILAKIQVA